MHPCARAAALGLFLGALCLAQEAPDPFFAERVLPGNPLLYLSVPQSASVSEDYAKSNLSKLLAHPEIRALAGSLEAWWHHRKLEAGKDLPFTNETVKAMLGLSLDEIWDALQGPLSFTVYDLPVGNPHKLDLVLTLGAREAAKLEKAAQSLKQQVIRQGGLKEGEFAHGGVTIHELGDASSRIFYTVLESTLVVTTTQERLEKAIDAVPDKGFAGLRQDPAFKAARDRVTPENRHFFLLHLNLERLLQQFRPEIGDEGLRILDTLGLSDLGSVAMSLGYDGPHLRERYALMTRRQDRGLLRMVAGKATTDPYAAWVPRDALAYSHSGLDLGALYEIVRGLAKVHPDVERAVEGSLGQFEKRTGLKLEEAFASLGPSWTSWSTLPEGGGIWPDSITAVPVRNVAAFESAVEKACKEGGFPIEELSFRGQRIRYITFSLERLLDSAPTGLPDFVKIGTTLSYLVKDQTLFFSSHPMALKRLLLRPLAPGASIAESPTYAALSRGAPGAWDAWFYADLGRAVALVYGLLEPFSHFGRDMLRDETGKLVVDLAQLPLEETLAELLGGWLTQKRTLEDAILIESRSNTGATVTLVGAYSGIIAVAIPGFMRSRGGAEAAGVAVNEQIAEVSLQLIRSAEDTFKNSDSDANGVADYWTRDVAGLHALKDRSGQAIFLLDPATAAADPEGAARYGLPPAPKNGYFYKMMVSDPDGQVYQKDDGKTNKTRYGVVAYPAVHGATGRFTFITNESGKTWKKDTGGKPVDKWPGKDPAQDGWIPSQ